MPGLRADRGRPESGAGHGAGGLWHGLAAGGRGAARTRLADCSAALGSLGRSQVESRGARSPCHTCPPTPAAPHCQFLVYTVFMLIGAAALWDQAWLLDTQQLWHGWPHHEFTCAARAGLQGRASRGGPPGAPAAAMLAGVGSRRAAGRRRRPGTRPEGGLGPRSGNGGGRGMADRFTPDCFTPDRFTPTTRAPLPSSPCAPTCRTRSLPMRVLYDCELSFYFASIFMLIFWEVRRNDFAVMLVHHLATVGLLAASLYNWCVRGRGRGAGLQVRAPPNARGLLPAKGRAPCRDAPGRMRICGTRTHARAGASESGPSCRRRRRQRRLAANAAALTPRPRTPRPFACFPSFWRVGALVMALHDACDVLMEAAKAFNYTKRDEAATAAFVAFLVAWAALRLTALPLMVVRSALFELPEVLGGRPAMWWGFCGGLLLLVALHVYWFTLIVRVAYLRVVTGDGRDLREEDED
jgi:hypothetical protein